MWECEGPSALARAASLPVPGRHYLQVLNKTELELLAERATSDEPWGPHGKDLGGVMVAAHGCQALQAWKPQTLHLLLHCNFCTHR